VQYVWSPVYVDALVLRDRDSNGDGTLDERLYVAQDANHNITALLDNAGNVVERYVYDPFGSVTVLDADWTERSGGSEYAWHYLHQGGRFDVTSGLYHFRYRDYSPTLGRWPRLDPLRYDAGDVNLYRVVFNAPTVFTDPSGNIPIIPFVAAGAIAGWWLLGPGASTANAPAPSQEILRPLPRSFLEDAVAGLPGALAGGGTALAEEAAVVVGGTILRRPRPRGVPRPQPGIAPTTTPRITFGHGARHLEGSGLSQAAVESAIEGAVRAIPNAATHWGWVQVNGQWIQYRAFVLPDGTINIGIYVRVPGNLSNARVP